MKAGYIQDIYCVNYIRPTNNRHPARSHFKFRVIVRMKQHSQKEEMDPSHPLQQELSPPRLSSEGEGSGNVRSTTRQHSPGQQIRSRFNKV